MKVIRTLTMALIAVLPGANAMAGISATAVAQKVQALYDRTSSMKAGFEQVASMKTLGISEHDEGMVYMKKDGKIRWEYKKPKEQLIVSNGTTIWFYMPSDRQVIIGSFAKSFKYKPTQTFLTGMGKILRDFKVRFDDSKELNGVKDAYVLQLVPKKTSGGSPAKIVIAVNKKDFLITRSMIFDKYGNKTEIIFSNIRLNTAMADSLFTFVPPKDVEVIHSPAQ